MINVIVVRCQRDKMQYESQVDVTREGRYGEKRHKVREHCPFRPWQRERKEKRKQKGMRVVPDIECRFRSFDVRDPVSLALRCASQSRNEGRRSIHRAVGVGEAVRPAAFQVQSVAQDSMKSNVGRISKM